MLTYLYTLDYDGGDAFPAVAMAVSQNTDSIGEDPTSKPDVVDDATVCHFKRMNNIHVYAIADKYNMPALKELAKTKFINNKSPPNAASATAFSEVINAIFHSTPDTDSGLRDVVIQRCSRAIVLEKILENDLLASVIRDHGTFALGILREISRSTARSRRSRSNALEAEQSS